MENIGEANQRALNHGAKLSDFKVGQRVKIVCLMEDWHFWYGETGKIIDINELDLFPIKVELDEVRVFKRKEGQVDLQQTSFCFRPKSLAHEKDVGFLTRLGLGIRTVWWKFLTS